MTATEESVRRAIDDVWRVESPRLIGGLTRLLKDVGAAEEMAQEALVTALERWPSSGIPPNPGAWLMATAKHRAIDMLRRRGMLDRKHRELQEQVEPLAQPEPPGENPELAFDIAAGDDVLRLMFMACHPVLATEARVALTLRLLGGLSTEEIARAFLVPEPTLAQRIVRAKRTLKEARVPFELPNPGELAGRLSSVLEVVYLIFNEGYSATKGDAWLRPELAEDAIRLGRMLAELMPSEPEVHGLLALMQLQASRNRARVDEKGDPILLSDQDRALWDRRLIEAGLAALERAEQLQAPLGPYTLQAAIGACHARANSTEQTDWVRMVALYDGLSALTGSPIVELNRAVAVSMAFGPAAGLALVEPLTREPLLNDYHLLPSVRGDLLAKLGQREAARAEFERAATLTKNDREREFLLRRARECGKPLGVC